MTRTNAMIICVLTTVLTISGIVQATPISVIMAAETDFDVVGDGFSAIGNAMITDFSANSLGATVVSQAFTNGIGDYLYLYQISNDGAAGDHIITRFTATPYNDAGDDIVLGYLTANIPNTSTFSLGDQAPLYGDVDSDGDGDVGATVGFNFPVGIEFYSIPDSYIGPGKKSRVLYIKSSLPPGIVTGNIINGGVQSGDVVGPVPEPATLSLLALGGLTVLLRRRRQ